MVCKDKICGILIIVGCILVVAFLGIIAYEFFTNHWRIGTLPFRMVIAIHGMRLFVPGIILIVVGILARK